MTFFSTLVFTLSLVTAFSQYQDSIRVSTGTVVGMQEFTSADFDGDGDNDIFASSIYDSKVSYFENNGDATFKDQVILFNENIHARELFPDDIDNDGDQDVICLGGDKLVVYRNDGSAGFTRETLLTGASPYSKVQLDDYDGDGDSDFIINRAGANYSIGFYENVNGVFSDPVELNTTGNQLLLKDIADLNGDQNKDLIVGVTYNGGLFFMPGNGDGTFGPQQTIAPGGQGGLACLDIDNDGDIDLVTTNSGGTKRYNNNGSGVFTLQVINNVSGGEMKVADKNNDGFPEIYFQDEMFKIHYIPNINGVFGEMQYIECEISSSDPAICFADLNGDGFQEIIAERDSWFYTLVNINGNYTSHRNITTVLNLANKRILDFNNDGVNDIVSSGTYLNWFPGNADGSYGVQNVIIVPNSTNLYSKQLEDIDNDGDLDIITSENYPGTDILIYKNDGAGTFFEIVEVPTGNVTSVNVSIEDLDNDNLKDFIFSKGTSNVYSIYWMKNQGGNTFSAPIQIASNLTSEYFKVLTGDFNNDGKNDILYPQNGIVTILNNQGNGNFSAPVSLTGLGTPYLAGLMDTDGDGDMDLYTDDENDNLIILENTGDNNFTVHSLGAPELDWGIVPYDTDSDGDVDILSVYNGQIYLYENTGGGNYGQSEIFPFTSMYVSALMIGNYTDDNMPDMLLSASETTNPIRDELYLFSNLSIFNNPGFSINSYVSPSGLETCDGSVLIAADGEPDFIFDIDNGSSVTSDESAYFNNLCPGIYTAEVTDGNGETLNSTFVIPAITGYIFNNVYPDAVPEDSLGITVENCNIDFTTIDTAFILYTNVSNDTVSVMWTVVDAQGAIQIPATYVLTNGAGVYYLQLSIYCPEKATGQYFTVEQSVYFDGENQVLLDVKEISPENVSVYPNPSSQNVTISFSDPSMNLKVIDAAGKVIIERKVQSGSLVEMEKINAGIYFFELSNDKGTIVKKVVRN